MSFMAISVLSWWESILTLEHPLPPCWGSQIEGKAHISMHNVSDHVPSLRALNVLCSGHVALKTVSSISEWRFLDAAPIKSSIVTIIVYYLRTWKRSKYQQNRHCNYRWIIYNCYGRVNINDCQPQGIFYFEANMKIYLSLIITSSNQGINITFWFCRGRYRRYDVWLDYWRSHFHGWLAWLRCMSPFLTINSNHFN